MYDAFNGAAQDEDPVDKGRIGPDGVHLGHKGRAVQVEVLDALDTSP